MSHRYACSSSLSSLSSSSSSSSVAFCPLFAHQCAGCCVCASFVLSLVSSWSLCRHHHRLRLRSCQPAGAFIRKKASLPDGLGSRRMLSVCSEFLCVFCKACPSTHAFGQITTQDPCVDPCLDPCMHVICLGAHAWANQTFLVLGLPMLLPTLVMRCVCSLLAQWRMF